MSALFKQRSRDPVPSNDEIMQHHDPDPDENPWVLGRPGFTPIEICAYDPRWPARYKALAAEIRRALGDAALDVEHIGSTAVPGLAAKNVIDMDLTVANPRDEAEYVPALEDLGYTLMVREPSFHEHRCLQMSAPRANLHVFGPACPEVIRHRMFRDWLRENVSDRMRYEDAKRSGAKNNDDSIDYNERKEPVIRDIYRRIFEAAGML